jgi:Peptidase A4 family
MGINAGVRGKLVRSRAVATGLLLAAALVPASAGTSAAAAVGFGPQGVHYADSIWGGYAVSGSNGEFTTISGSWTEPTVTCNTTDDLFAPWVGIDGYGNETVEQTGVQTDCSSGRPVLSAWYEMYPANPVYFSNSIAQGDKFTASVVSNGSHSYTLTISDTTKGWSQHVTKTLSSAKNATAEAVIESPTDSYPSFSKLSFTGITVDGQAFANYGPDALDSGGYGPSALSGGNFSMTPGFDGIRQGAHAEATTAQPGTIRY